MTRRGNLRRGWRKAVSAAAVPLLCAGLAACGQGADRDDPVVKAQARVDAAKQDLSDAQTEFTDRSAEFCGASETYILALDRYGDVLAQTAVTVGDVTDAGADLEQPGEEVVGAAEEAKKAQQAVVDAEHELAEAKADLAAAKKPGSTPSAVPSPSGSPEALVPPATLNRVEQAEAELEATRKGIADDTPLVQASESFNAAVVALEMAWLRLFADAGCLTDEQQKQAEAAVRDYTTTLQMSLREAGYYDGEVDGVYGPQTVAAVEALQAAHGLPSTGTVDKATAAALQDDLAATGGAAVAQELVATAAVQQTLKLAGFWDGPVDGQWTPALTQALKELQTALGVKPTGTVDAATLAALETAVSEAQADETPSSPTESPAESTDPSPTPTESTSG